MGFNLQTHIEVSQVETRQDTSLGIMRWGRSNAFPQTLINFIDQSANAHPTVNRTAQFYKGQGFKGEDTIVGPNGLTAKHVVDILCEDYARFKALAIHANYNLEGKVSSITPMRIATLRFNEFDELNYASKLGYHPNFGLNATEKKNITKYPSRGDIKWFNRFNPEVVLRQIEMDAQGIIGNYNGQILYYSDSGHSSYPIPPLQAPINYVLSDIDTSILVRKQSATGFINTYLLKTSLDSEDVTLIKLEESIAQSQGARGSGRVITLSSLSPEEIGTNVLEELGSGSAGAKSTMESAGLAYELDQKAITGAYLIPPILAGIGIQNGFTGVDLADAYDVFNAITQPGRDIIEQQFNKILECSEFKGRLDPIKIIPLSIDGGKDESSEVVEEAPEAFSASVQRNPLTGRQEQSLQRVVRKYNKGELTRAQAEDQLRNDLGFDEQRISTWLGE